MPYVDTDFFVALLKSKDWKKDNAHKLLKEHEGKIWTSKWTLAEMLMISERFGFDTENVIGSIAKIAEIKDNIDDIWSAAHIMKEHKLTVFDALHAATCGRDAIISSDKSYDKIHLKRIAL